MWQWCRILTTLTLILFASEIHGAVAGCATGDIRIESTSYYPNKFCICIGIGQICSYQLRNIVSTDICPDGINCSAEDITSNSQTILKQILTEYIISVTSLIGTFSSDDLCLNSSCENNTACFNTNGSSSCPCNAGWTGQHCNIDINECEGDKPCYNGGLCHNTNGSYECGCLPGWTGRHCGEAEDLCQSSPCLHSTECINTNGTYRCMCEEGWTGYNCNVDIDECDTTKGTVCLHGGSCNNTLGSFFCACQDGWNGSQCSEDINECLRNPCNDSTICINTYGSYTCISNSSLCQEPCVKADDLCQNSPCLHSTECINTNGTYRCLCEEGWTGYDCSVDIDECNTTVDTPCLHGGACNNTVGSFFCECQDGWHGSQCSEDMNECFQNPCNDSTICINTYGSYTCISNSSLCQEPCVKAEDLCQNSPCQHSTECINTNGTYRCLCEEGWTGYNCSVGERCGPWASCTDIDECDTTLDTLCLHGGTCNNTVGSFFCACKDGWNGSRCSEFEDPPFKSYLDKVEYWSNPANQKRQLETLNKTIKEIKKNLTIDRNHLRSSINKRISAADSRTSAAVAGYVGALFISLVVGLFLMLDCNRLCMKSRKCH